MKNSIVILGAAGAEETDHDNTTASTSENPIQKISKDFHLYPELLLPQLIVFIIVLLALRKFAYAPILSMLEERKSRIKESLDNAEKIKVELAEAAATRKQLIDEASAQANKIIEEAKAAADKVQSTASQKAVTQAEEIIAKAKQAAENDRAMMLADLKKEVGQLVVQATTQVVGKVLTDDDKKRLIEETSKSIAA